MSQGRTFEYLSSQQATQHMRMRRTFKNMQDNIRWGMQRGQTKMAAVVFDSTHVIAVRLNKCKPSDASFVYIDSKWMKHCGAKCALFSHFVFVTSLLRFFFSIIFSFMSNLT